MTGPKGSKNVLPPEDERCVLTIRETAAYLRVDHTLVRRAIAAGDLPALRFGAKTIRISKAALERWLEENTRGGP